MSLCAGWVGSSGCAARPDPVPKAAARASMEPTATSRPVAARRPSPPRPPTLRPTTRRHSPKPDGRSGATQRHPPLVPVGPTLATKTLVIQPLGRKLPQQDVAAVAKALRLFYGIRVKVLPRRPLPRAAWYAPRRRWRAEKLLDHLERIAPKTAHRILGLTAADISTTKGKVHDWGIMGLATMDGRVCVISRFRCARGARNNLHARQRLAKTAVHEIGHTLGLDHCPTRGCLLEDGRGSNKTSDREYVICPRCLRHLKKRGIRLPPTPTPPWPKPTR